MPAASGGGGGGDSSSGNSILTSPASLAPPPSRRQRSPDSDPPTNTLTPPLPPTPPSPVRQLSCDPHPIATGITSKKNGHIPATAGRASGAGNSNSSYGSGSRGSGGNSIPTPPTPLLPPHHPPPQRSSDPLPAKGATFEKNKQKRHTSVPPGRGPVPGVGDGGGGGSDRSSSVNGMPTPPRRQSVSGRRILPLAAVGCDHVKRGEMKNYSGGKVRGNVYIRAGGRQLIVSGCV